MLLNHPPSTVGSHAPLEIVASPEMLEQERYYNNLLLICHCNSRLIIPSINIIYYRVSLCRAMLSDKILIDPSYQIVFECTLDNLMK